MQTGKTWKVKVIKGCKRDGRNGLTKTSWSSEENAKFCTLKEKKKKIQQNKWKTWVDKERLGQKIFLAFHRQADLACPSYASLVYTALQQFYNTFKYRIQNTWLGFCLLKFPQITTASALDSNTKKSVGKIHWCSLKFEIHYPLHCRWKLTIKLFLVFRYSRRKLCKH